METSKNPAFGKTQNLTYYFLLILIFWILGFSRHPNIKIIAARGL